MEDPRTAVLPRWSRLRRLQRFLLFVPDLFPGLLHGHPLFLVSTGLPQSVAEGLLVLNSDADEDFPKLISSLCSTCAALGVLYEISPWSAHLCDVHWDNSTAETMEVFLVNVFQDSLLHAEMRFFMST